MTIYDLIIAGIFVGFLFWGFFRGIIREIFETVGLILAVFLAFKFAATVAPQIPVNLPPTVSILIAGLLIVIAVVITAKLLGWMVYKSIVRGPLRIADRSFGAILGAIKAVVIILAIVTPLTFTPYGAKLDAAAERSPVIPLRWTMAAARPLGQYFGATIANTISKKIMSSLPSLSRDLEKDQVQTIMDRAEEMREEGLTDLMIVEKLKGISNSAGEQIHDSQLLADLLDQTDRFKASGLNKEQIAEVMTNTDLQVDESVIKDVIGQFQKLQLAGEKFEMKEFMGNLSDESREKAENIMNNPTLKHALRSVDPAEFAKQTGVKLESLVKQLGMEEQYKKYKDRK